MSHLVKKILLLPFSGLYGLITDVRNWLFDKRLMKSVRPNLLSISVGNLVVGGTGKTPMVELLIKWYTDAEPGATGATATLSRGYGRRTTGFRNATDADTAATIGDEPLQLYRKFGTSIRVCVGERRADALRTLQQLHPETRRVLLDDAFQHRTVRPHLSILLTDYNRPFYEDYPFPAGRLRERRTGACRADIVVVTKCSPELPPADQQIIADRIHRYARPGVPVCFARLHYGPPVSFARNQPVGGLRAVMLVSGLANADLLEKYVRQTFLLTRHHRFADHYAYTRADLDRLLTNLPADTALLTTEKDWVKLDALLTADERQRLPLFYLPIELWFLPGSEPAFRALLDESNLKNR